MTNYFEIEGYWKDDNEGFGGYIVSDMDSAPDESEPYTDDQIFFYGLSEENLKEAIELKEDTSLEFVITSYQKL